MKTHTPPPLSSLRCIIALAVTLLAIPSKHAAPSPSAKINHTDGCNTKVLHQAADAHARSINLRFVESAVKCDRNWAVLAGDLEDPHAPIGGPQGVGTTIIFHRESGVWKHKDTSSVCGTLNPVKPQAKPKDARIPSSLYFLGCLVG